MNREELEKFEIGLYNNNQTFIDKAIFTFASASIPLLINFSDKLELYHTKTFILYILSLASFVSVAILQIISFYIGNYGCALDLVNKNYSKKPNNWTKVSFVMDIILAVILILAIIITSITVFTDISYKREEYMNKKRQNQAKVLHNSLTLNKTISPNPDNGQNQSSNSSQNK